MSESKYRKLFKIIVPIGSICFTLLLTEIVLQFFKPDEIAPKNVKVQVRNKSNYIPDEKLGYRPAIQNIEGRGYSQFATKKNNYSIEKPNDVSRILFLGDSVTNRSKIINALRDQLGEENFEYWNAGVEGYTTTQQLGLYKRWNHALDVDHVILTLHFNDFATGIVYFYNSNNELISWRSNYRFQVNPWWFNHSELYRYASNFLLDSLGKLDRETRTELVREPLSELKELLDARDVRFTVLILPRLDYWIPKDISTNNEDQRARLLKKQNRELDRRWHRPTSIKLLKALQIEYVDLEPARKRAVTDGIKIQQSEGDKLHPNDKVAVYFVEDILSKIKF